VKDRFWQQASDIRNWAAPSKSKTLEAVMRKGLVFLTVLMALGVGSSERCRVSASEPLVVTATEPVPVHCQIPAHAARMFVGSVGVAIGFGGSARGLQACLLLRQQ
jgi:hypothetical protein